MKLSELFFLIFSFIGLYIILRVVDFQNNKPNEKSSATKQIGNQTDDNPNIVVSQTPNDDASHPLVMPNQEELSEHDIFLKAEKYINHIDDDDWLNAIDLIREVEDRVVLLEIVKKGKNKFMRIYAAERLDDLQIYEEIATNTNEVSEVRHHAIPYLTNQTLRAYIALHDPDWAARLRTIWQYHNREILEQMANHDSHSVVRNEAARRLDELRKQDIILTNAQINREEFEQMEEGIRTTFWFIMKNTDQKRLAEIAKNYGDDLMRRGVIPLLNDQTVLADIAKNDKVPQVRQLAIGKLEDQTILKDILENDKDEWARNEAEKKLNELINKNKHDE